MKLTHTISLASALLLAGCAHEEHSMRTDESVSPGYGYSSGQSEYTPQNNLSSSPSAGGTYSSGAGGAYSGNTGVSEAYSGRQSESDNAIVAQAREALQRDPEIAFVVPSIQISANNGAIVLNGSVQSEEQKRQILSKVQQVTGVVTVNNQLNVMAGSNGQWNSNDSQMNPTGSGSGADRLYKDAANGGDNSTNNALNPTSTRDNGANQLYRESNQGASSSSGSVNYNLSSSNSISGGELNATSRTNGQSQLYQQGNQGGNEQNMNNSSTNSLNPTSRENGNSQIYQGNPGENGENSNTNSNRQMP